MIAAIFRTSLSDSSCAPLHASFRTTNARRSATCRLLVGLVATSLVGMFALSAAAQNVVSLTPASQSVDVTDPSVTIDLEIDFSDVTVGGGLEVTFDATRLAFDSFVFTADPNFLLLGPAPSETVQPLEVGFGWLIIGPPFGVTGAHSIGTFTFTPLAEGSAFVQSAESVSSPGPFFAPGGVSPLAVSFDGASINVVPEPGIAAGLAMGSLALCFFRERSARGTG